MSTPAYDQHRHAAEPLLARCAVITLSDTRSASEDAGGDFIEQSLTAAGHSVLVRQLIPDDPARLQQLLNDLLSRPDLDAILTTGGTGISRRDQTIPVVQAALTLTLDGFGELFRMLSYHQIGSGALLSRAVAGVATPVSPPPVSPPPHAQPPTPKLLFALPGSPAAVELALTKLILPELKHLLRELRR